MQFTPINHMLKNRELMCDSVLRYIFLLAASLFSFTYAQLQLLHIVGTHPTRLYIILDL